MNGNRIIYIKGIPHKMFDDVPYRLDDTFDKHSDALNHAKKIRNKSNKDMKVLAKLETVRLTRHDPMYIVYERIVPIERSKKVVVR